MARNSSGQYSLPSSVNPVVSGTTITTTWANTTLTDIATEITNSLDRSGRGAMTQPLQLPNGTAAAPAMTFSEDTNTGLYKPAADQIGLATGGNARAILSSTALTMQTLPLLIDDGQVGAPGLAFRDDTDTGLYLAADGDMRAAVAGADKLTITAALTTVAGNVSLTGEITTALTIAAALTVEAGITVTQSTANGDGIHTTGNGSGDGIHAVGGSSSGVAVRAEAGAGNGGAVVATPTGTGIGVDVQAAGGTGYGVVITGNATTAPFRVIPQGSAPTGTHGVGAMYVDTAGVLYICTTAGTPGTFTKVGTQT